MLTPVLLLLGQVQGPQPQQASLTLHGDTFNYKGAGVSCSERVAPAAPPAQKVVFRKDDNFAVWDSRGISVRHGKKAKSSKLVEMALTPKLFTRDEILRTKTLLGSGIRRKEASALSGAMRLGNDAFFLVRWVESTGKPWLEALVKVDLDSGALKPSLVGKFDGLSLAGEPVDDKVFLLGGALCVITKSESGWSLAKYDPALKTFSSDALGVGLVSFTPLGREMGVFVEKKQTGSLMIGRIDLSTGTRRNLHETREPVEILDGKRPSVAILGHSWLLNLESGAKTPVPAGAGVRRTPAGVLVWWPLSAPTKAVMLDPERWTQLAKWSQGGPGTGQGNDGQ